MIVTQVKSKHRKKEILIFGDTLNVNVNFNIKNSSFDG